MNAAQPGDSDAGPAPTPGPPDRPRPGGRRRLGTVVVVAGLIAVALGVAAGQVWRLVAPRVPIVKLERGFAYADGQPEQAVAADGWFGLLGIVAGVLAAVMAWQVLRHRRGVAVLTALVVGSLLGGWFGWWLGARLESAAFEARAAATPVGATLDAPLSLRVTNVDREHPWPVGIRDQRVTPNTTGVIVAQALAAAFTYTVLAAFAVDPDLRPNPPELSDEQLGQPGPAVDPPGLAGPDSSLSSAPGGPADPKAAPELT